MKFLIIDDHPLVGSGLGRLLALEFGAQILDARTAADGHRLFRVERPELTIVDLNLPDRSGLSLLQAFREEAPGRKLLVLSMLDDALTVSACLAAGASAYVTKSAAPAIVIEAVRAALAGERFIEPAVAGKLASVAPASPSASPFADLPAHDLELLRLIFQGLRGPAIAQTLGVSEKTVANRKSLLRSRLGAETDIELMRLAVAAGLSPE